MQKPLPGFFTANAINIGLPIVECRRRLKASRDGDEVEVDFDSGVITNKTKEPPSRDRHFRNLCRKS